MSLIFKMYLFCVNLCFEGFFLCFGGGFRFRDVEFLLVFFIYGLVVKVLIVYLVYFLFCYCLGNRDCL